MNWNYLFRIRYYQINYEIYMNWKEDYSTLIIYVDR